MKNKNLLLALFLFVVACENQHYKKNNAAREKSTIVNTGLKKTNMDIIELRDGTSIKCKALTEEDYNTLLKNAIGGPIDKYNKKYGYDVRLLNNNQVLTKDRNYYTLYFSLQDIDKVILDFDNGHSNGTELLLNKNKYGEDFPSNTNVLIKQLLDTLDIPKSEPSEELLKALDSKIDNMQDADIFRKEHFINLIAVVGEAALKKNRDAEWDMKQATDRVTWNPSIKIHDKKVDFIGFFYEDIFSWDGSYKRNVLYEIYLTVNDIVKINLR